MGASIGIAVVLIGYLAVAALQDGPLQVWLLALSPFALAAIGVVLHITDYSRRTSEKR